MLEVEQVLEKIIKKMADKEELKQTIKHFEKMVKNLHQYMKAKFSALEDEDDVMLSKRPLQGFACASCEKGVKKMGATSDKFQDWNRMQSKEHIAKVGSGFSKILAMLKPGGVGGGGTSTMGTLRHLQQESDQNTSGI